MYDNATSHPDAGHGEEESSLSAPAIEYKVSITGPGVSIEKQIAADQLFGILSVVLGGKLPPAQAPVGSFGGAQTNQGVQPLDGRPPQSMREFLNGSGAKTIPQKLLTMAVYNKQVLGRETIGRDDFKPLFQRAGEPMPANIPRDLRIALTQGWLEESHTQPGVFYVTATGEGLVDNGFEGDSGRAAKRPRRKAKRTAKPKAETGATDQ